MPICAISRSALVGFVLTTIVLSVPVVAQQAQSTDQTASGNATQLQEVLVTAQKKTENLLDVPGPVTAISAQSLIDTNQCDLRTTSLRFRA